MSDEETYKGRHRHEAPEPECTCAPVVELRLGGRRSGEVNAYHEDHCAIVVERRGRLHLTGPTG